MKLSKSFTRRETILLLLLTVTGLFAFYLFVVHRPITVEMEQLDLEKEDALLELQILTSRKAKMDEISAELATLLADPNATAIPDHDNLNHLMAFLDSALTPTVEYTLDMRDPIFSEDSNLVRRTMDLTFLSENYEDACAVVDALHSCPYRSLMDNLSMTPASREAEDHTTPSLHHGPVQVSLTITFFERQ